MRRIGRAAVGALALATARIPLRSAPWPALCGELLERKPPDEDSVWTSSCRSFHYRGVDGFGASTTDNVEEISDEDSEGYGLAGGTLYKPDAMLCGLSDWGHWHRSMVCELFRLATDCIDLPCAPRSATPATLRAGLRRGSASLPKGAADYVEVLLVVVAPAVMDLFPRKEITFRAFTALYIVTGLCLREQPKGVQRIFHFRPRPLGREGCQQLVAEHFESTLEASSTIDAHKLVAEARSEGDEARVRKHLAALLPEGPLGVVDDEPAEKDHYSQLPPRDSLWSPFVVRAPRSSMSRRVDVGGLHWAELQEAWGWQNAWAAVKLAGKLDEYLPTDADETSDAVDAVDKWLDALGGERASMLDGRMTVEGSQHEVGYRRWRDSHQTLTPISGYYRPMWRAALFRRVSERGVEAAAIFSSIVEDPALKARSWRCGAVLTWAELPRGTCEDAFNDHEGANDPKSSNALLHTSEGRCRLVLNRAILRTPVDAAALGLDDCASWFGVDVVEHNASYASRPQWLHADVAATEILQRHVMPPIMRRLWTLVQALRTQTHLLGAANSDDVQAQLPTLLEAAIGAIAEFTFFLFSAAPYTRGSASIGVLSNHAMILWLLGPASAHVEEKVTTSSTGRARLARYRLQALRCLPNWRAHSMPDIEAASSQTPEHYVRSAYWASFSGPSPEKIKQQLIECLISALNPSDADAFEAEERGRHDAEVLREVLSGLKGSNDARRDSDDDGSCSRDGYDGSELPCT